MYSAVLKKRQDPSEAALLTALVGEIGNNCFDHNLGHWPDVAGCWFDYSIDTKTIWVVVADRGRGIFDSLKSVDSSLQNSQEALQTAYTKIISGRFPEKRGNGLKFVSAVMNHQQPRGLVCVSSDAALAIGKRGEEAKSTILPLLKNKNSGTLTFMLWDK